MSTNLIVAAGIHPLTLRRSAAHKTPAFADNSQFDLFATNVDKCYTDIRDINIFLRFLCFVKCAFANLLHRFYCDAHEN